MCIDSSKHCGLANRAGPSAEAPVFGNKGLWKWRSRVLFLLLHACNWLSPRAGSAGVCQQTTAASRTTWKTRDAVQLASDTSSCRVQSREAVSLRCGIGSLWGVTQLGESAASEHGDWQGWGCEWDWMQGTKGVQTDAIEAGQIAQLC